MPAYTVYRANEIAQGLLEMADAARHLLAVANRVNLSLGELGQPPAMNENQCGALNNLATTWRERANAIHRRVLSDESEEERG